MTSVRGASQGGIAELGAPAATLGFARLGMIHPVGVG